MGTLQHAESGDGHQVCRLLGRQVWTTLRGYVDHNWDDLCDELREEYVSPSTEGQFSRQKLVDLASKYARTRMAMKPTSFITTTNSTTKQRFWSIPAASPEGNGTRFSGAVSTLMINECSESDS